MRNGNRIASFHLHRHKPSGTGSSSPASSQKSSHVSKTAEIESPPFGIQSEEENRHSLPEEAQANVSQRISATDLETPKSVNLATVPISVPGSEPAETTIVPPTAPAVAATEKATPAVSTVAATVNAPSTVQAVARAEIVPPAVITVAATEDVSLAGLPEPEKTAGRNRQVCRKVS
ncbi:hypothetical protein YC2023_081641 [Brassica napus]